ncbi:MAG TPA: hypothetical protein VMY77_14495 [Chitinophagaceae bacterium]|nr:hypothetical protein [Chitinophagaceae bacterium]
MPTSTIKTNNDNSLIEGKVNLRLQSLPDKKEINVLEAFGGEGVLWSIVQRKAPDKKINVLSIDKNKYGRVQLQGDNLKFLHSLNLSEFDIIDLDAWGSPINQLEVLFERKYTGIVHCTFIQTMQGCLSKKMLRKLGYTDAMMPKCQSLFNKNGIEKFLNYLSISGIKKVNIISQNHVKIIYGFMYKYFYNSLVMNNL